MNKSNRFSPETRERAVRMVQEHRHKAKVSDPEALQKIMAALRT